VRFARSRPPILLEAQGRAVEANEGEPDAYGNPRSRCPEANSSDEELTEPRNDPEDFQTRFVIGNDHLPKNGTMLTVL